MSRLRRLSLSDRFFFLTVRLLPRRHTLDEGDFKRLARSVQNARFRHKFLPTAWVFLPDHEDAIIFPTYPRTTPLVMKSIKVRSMMGINWQRRQSGELGRRGPA